MLEQMEKGKKQDEKVTTRSARDTQKALVDGGGMTMEKVSNPTDVPNVQQQFVPPSFLQEDVQKTIVDGIAKGNGNQ